MTHEAQQLDETQQQIPVSEASTEAVVPETEPVSKRESEAPALTRNIV